MHSRTKSIFSFAMIFAFVFLIGVNKAHAWSAPSDLTQPFEYGPYTINMPLILAEDSILWELLEDFDTLHDDDCGTLTETFIAENRTAMENLFPWFDSDDDIDEGASTFCSILRYIPSAMAEGFAGAGILPPRRAEQLPMSANPPGETTDLWDYIIVPNWHEVHPFIIDHPLVRIEFTEEIDLISYDFVSMILGFATAFDVNTGYIALNSEMIQGLKSTGAIITLKNVPAFENPAILVDGKLDEKLISALVYDPEAKTVTFNTNHFTSFEVVEYSSIPVEDEDDDNDKKRPKIYSAKIERLTYADGRDYYKVTAKGKNYDKKFNMYLGGRKSIKEKRINKRRAVGYFKVSDFENEPQETLKFKVYNSSKRKRTYDYRLPIYNIPHQYMK